MKIYIYIIFIICIAFNITNAAEVRFEKSTIRIETKSATQTAISYLQAHRWDDTLIRNVRTF